MSDLSFTSFNARPRVGSLARLGWWVLGMGVLAIWLGLAIWANLDASAGRPMLFMDELISFDGVNAIQGSASGTQLLDNLVGPDQRYGRPLWWYAWIVSAPIEPLAGDQGQIIATRMGFAMLVATSSLGLADALVRGTGWRVLALTAALVVPFSSYYATMPKPEPLMLTFLAGFIWLLARRENVLGWPFLLLGLAFGAKISALPIVVILGGFAVLRAALLLPPKLLATGLRRSALSFFGGFAISVPIAFLAPPAGFLTYVESTWANRGHYHDDPSIGLLDWLGYVQDEAFFGAGWLSWAIVIVMAGAISAALWRARGDGSMREQLGGLVTSHAGTIFAVALAGAAAMGAIFVSTDRLWGFYLYPGVLLISVAAIAATEELAASRLQHSARMGVFALAGLAFAGNVYAGASHTIGDFETLAHRSSSAEFIAQSSRHEAVLAASAAEAERLGRPVSVAYSAQLWHPDDTDTATYFTFFKTFAHWQLEDLDLVILHERDVDFSLQPQTPENLSGVEIAREALFAHTEYGGPCSEAPCWRELPIATEGVHIFQRIQPRTVTSLD